MNGRLKIYQITILCFYTLFLVYLCFKPLALSNSGLFLAGYSGLVGLIVCIYPSIKLFQKCNSWRKRIIFYWLFPFIFSSITYFCSTLVDYIYFSGRSFPRLVPSSTSFYEFILVLMLGYNFILSMWVLPILLTIGELIFKKGTKR